jgi:hypothetical protein
VLIEPAPDLRRLDERVAAIACAAHVASAHGQQVVVLPRDVDEDREPEQRDRRERRGGRRQSPRREPFGRDDGDAVSMASAGSGTMK